MAVNVVDEYMDQEKYKQFNAKHYLEYFYREPDHETIPAYQDIFGQFEDKSLKILEFGGGPSLLQMLIAAPKASEIVFADFVLQNRQEVQKWMQRDPSAFNWRPTIECILEEEEKYGEAAITEREECLRAAISNVVHCDICAESPVEKGFEGPYNLIHSANCLESVCKSVEQWSEFVSKLLKLLTLDGVLVLVTDVGDEQSYPAGILYNTPAPINEELARNAINKNGLEITWSTTVVETTTSENYEYIEKSLFIVAKQKH